MSIYVVVHNAFGDVCVPVAIVEAENVDDVYRDTNNISNPWIYNESVKAVSENADSGGGCRSTSVGDIIIKIHFDSDGKIDCFGFKGEIVSGCGFKPVGEKIESLMNADDGRNRLPVEFETGYMYAMVRDFYNRLLK